MLKYFFFNRKYMSNYMKTFSRAKYVFVSAAKNGGWHHVEVHEGFYVFFISRFVMV